VPRARGMNAPSMIGNGVVWYLTETVGESSDFIDQAPVHLETLVVCLGALGECNRVRTQRSTGLTVVSFDGAEAPMHLAQVMRIGIGRTKAQFIKYSNNNIVVNAPP
jgi:hypothetical protein